MDQLRAIRIFLEVARHRSFAAAARGMNLTPTAVTRAVSALEANLGTQLLVRTTRQVSLTSDGAVYAARVAPLMDGLEGADRALRARWEDETGRIRVNAPLSLGTRVLPEVLTAFRAAHPGIALSLTLSDEFVDIVDADYDLAIRISGPPSDKSTIWRKICLVERVLVTAPHTKLAAAASPDDLPLDALLAYSPDGREETWDLRCDQNRRSLTAGATLSANNGDVLAQLAETGGVALLPRFIVNDALEDGRLVLVLPDWRPPDIWLTLYYPPYEKLPVRLARFSDFFEHHVTVTRPLSPLLNPAG